MSSLPYLKFFFGSLFWGQTLGGPQWNPFRSPHGTIDEKGQLYVGENSMATLWLCQNNYGKSHPFLMGKLTISTGPFSIAMLNYQRV